jgi:Uma2 family endonuclease
VIHAVTPTDLASDAERASVPVMSPSAKLPEETSPRWHRRAVAVAINPSQMILPPGQSVLFEAVDWAAFEAFLEQMGDRPGMRLAYDDEVLELMTPLLEHEDDKEIIGDLIRALLEVLDIEFRSIGSTTLRSATAAKGIEPDQCFYIAHERAIRGRRTIDLGTDPPPDLALEIDITTRRDHRPIYAALRIPELWRFDGKRLHIFCLRGDAYAETGQSDQFAGFPLTEAIPRFLAQSRIDGRNAALRAFRAWARQVAAAQADGAGSAG